VKACRRVQYSCPYSSAWHWMKVSSNSRPCRFTPRKKPGYPSNMRLNGPQSWCGRFGRMVTFALSGLTVKYVRLLMSITCKWLLESTYNVSWSSGLITKKKIISLTEPWSWTVDIGIVGLFSKPHWAESFKPFVDHSVEAQEQESLFEDLLEVYKWNSKHLSMELVTKQSLTS
jgi:hypothetical protein